MRYGYRPPQQRPFAQLRSTGQLERAMMRAGSYPAELSRKSGVSEATISGLRRGKSRNVTQASAKALADALGVDPADLFIIQEQLDFSDMSESDSVAT